MMIDNPRAKFELVISMVVKAINDTAGPDKCTSSDLLFE